MQTQWQLNKAIDRAKKETVEDRGQSRKRSKKERKSFIQNDRPSHNPPRISLGDQLN
ncbi:hypothetical protein V495_04563, partial [Pseudogymnoascus sp. VKM F-4514 (FW-929)]